MTMFNYESEELYQMVKGETIPTSPVYEADCKKEILTEVSPNYPKLTEYEKEWISFAKNIYKGGGTPVPLEYLEVQTDNHATVKNVIPFAYKSAILKGITSYRDIDTGEILEAFEEGRSLELVSVKMPVLKTVGKNLFDGEWEQGTIDQVTGELITSTNYRCKNKIPVVPLSQIVSNTSLNLLFYDENDLFVGYKFQSQGMTMQVPSGAVYMRFYRSSKMDGLQVEANTVTTTYEPYQSNILTVNEEVELRGVDNVQDELNLLTGELTERFGEVVLDGSESWRIKDDQIYIKNTDFPIPPLAHFPNGELIRDSDVQINLGKNYIFVVLQNDLPENIKQNNNTNTLSKWKSYLQQNPITVQYQLATESIKTVDLSRIIKPYEGSNNYAVSSHTLPPLLLLVVPIESTGNQTLNDIITEE